MKRMLFRAGFPGMKKIPIKKRIAREALDRHLKGIEKKEAAVERIYAKEGVPGLIHLYSGMRVMATALLARTFLDLKKKYGIIVEGGEAWTKLKKLEIPKLSKEQALNAFKDIREAYQRIDAKSDFLIEADIFAAQKARETKNLEEKKQLEDVVNFFKEHPPLAHYFLSTLLFELEKIIKRT